MDDETGGREQLQERIQVKGLLERYEMIQGTVFLWQIGTHEENGSLIASFSMLQLVGEFKPIHPRKMII